ncbi:MAG TPA: sugar phosphate nucleotidyltransferase [Bacteroidales bacterium]|nr:sugar phosphate nucleotidyltransferase [Bacteroidales bacterium]HRZ49911.1 sugar phosphate nucleotidyltransferase [Bacteroidales bacterium]
MKDRVIIQHTLSVQQALEILDDSPVKTLFLTDGDGRLCGSLTDGDVRRWILRNGDISGTVSDACNPSPYTLRLPFDRHEVLHQMKEKHLNAAPVVDVAGKIDSIVLISELSDQGSSDASALHGVPVVIMAGGKGTRLDPFTRILPKPLIPIGNQPVIEVIMHELARYGADRFIISLNHQARLIKAYFEDQQYPYDISFLEEDQPLGTAGALKMLEGKIEGDLLVSNCDVIIKSDVGEMLRFHRSGGFSITVVAALYNLSVPYGVCDVDEKGVLLRITEKPEFSMLINSGMYVLGSDCLSMIPESRMFHITHLIEAVQAAGKPVGVFPIPGSAYHDIGQWDAYHSALPKLT